MILQPSQWHDFYNGIREDKHISSQKKVSVFCCGTDVDSICALKVLQAILLSNQISFSLFASSSTDGMLAQITEEFGRDVRDYRTAFCLNCGATMDVAEIRGALTASARENVRFVFIDSHRPIHHSFNDDADQTFVVFHDSDGGDVPADAIPRAAAAEECAGPSRQRRRLDENGNRGNGESDEREDELEEYYARGSHYGIPASVILFRLAHQLQHNAGHLLWMAVLGLTEQLLLRRAHAASPHYVHAHAQLEAFCEELSAGDREQGLFDEEFGSDEEEDLNAPRVRGRSAQGRIRRFEETKLPLMRHWSLMDALVHAPDLVARLRCFKEGGPGRQVITYVLAQLGIPIVQAQMQYSQMKVQFKDANLLDGLLEMLGEWLGGPAGGAAPRLHYDSFAVEYGSRLTLSAADHVHALWAHLTAETASCARLTSTVWNAYKALDVRSACLLHGIELAKGQLRQLLQDVAMVEPGQARGEERIVHNVACPGPCLDLSAHDAWAAASPLVHPIALTRLGLILQDADAADAHAKPVGWVRAPAVCVGPPDADGCCMAVALPGERRARKHPVTGAPLFSSHNGVLNPFGAPRGLFRAAVEASQVHSAKTGYHDSATLSVGRHDASVLVGKLKPEWDERDRVVWSQEGIPDEIIRA